MLLQPLDTSRFARWLLERIDLDLPFRWFVGLCIDRAVRGASTTDPDARPDDSPGGQPSRPCAVGTGSMENQNGGGAHDPACGLRRKSKVSRRR